MTETEFLTVSEAIFDHIDDVLSETDLDIDCQKSGNILTLESDADGSQIIINRHTPNQEMWIAAKSGGYHFSLKNGQWLATRDESEFFDVLNQAISTLMGEEVHIPAYQSEN